MIANVAARIKNKDIFEIAYPRLPEAQDNANSCFWLKLTSTIPNCVGYLYFKKLIFPILMNTIKWQSELLYEFTTNIKNIKYEKQLELEPQNRHTKNENCLILCHFVHTFYIFCKQS